MFFIKTNFIIVALGVAFICTFLNGAQSQRRINPELQTRIEDYIESFYPASQTTGLGLSIVMNDGQILYSNGFGMADQERQIPALNSTQYTLGSVSKSLTGMLCAKVLHERFPHLGEAVLDTPIRKLLPEVNFTLIDRYRSEHLTFRDLLSHRVCVHANDLHVYSGQLSSAEELVYRARYNPAHCPLRTSFAYNNQMISIAGELAGIVANTTYEDAMHEMFEALGMTNSTVVKETDDYTDMPYRAMPYYFKNGEYHQISTGLIKRIVVALPAGGVTTTPDDMVKYMRAIINFGAVDGKQIIAREAIEWLGRISNFKGLVGPSYKNSEDDFIQSTLGYSLGHEIVAWDGWKLIRHEGYAPPYHTMVTTAPDLKIGIFSCSNTGPIRTNHHGLHAFLIELLRGNTESAEIRAQKISQQLEILNKERAEATKSDRHLTCQRLNMATLEITGKYGSGTSGEIEISERFNEETNQTQYYFDYGTWYRGWLVQKPEGNQFSVLWETEIMEDLYSYWGGDADPSQVIFTDENNLYFNGPVSWIAGTFTRGVSLENLPETPWEKDSCS